MSSQSDFIQDPSTETTDALWKELERFFAPLPQHIDAPSPETFDKDVAELDLNLPCKPLANDILPPFTPTISTPSALTYSTNSIYTSEQSDFSIPSEPECYYPLNNGIYETPGPHPAVFSNGQPSVPPLHPADAQFDFGTLPVDLSPHVGISPDDLSTAMQQPLQQPPTSIPTLPPVQVTPDSEAQMAPAPDTGDDRPFKCPYCPHASNRKHNLKTHINDTHHKLKRFKCDTCGHPFSRKDDRDRHLRNPNVHRKKTSVSSTSMRLSDPDPGISHRITINRDTRPTTSSSGYPEPIM